MIKIESDKQALLTVLIFMGAVFFLHRPFQVTGFYHVELILISIGMYAVLAFASVLFFPERLSGLLQKLTLPEKAAWLILLLTAIRFDCFSNTMTNFGENLLWIIIPFFAAIFRQELMRILPSFLMFIFYWDWFITLCMFFWEKDSVPYGMAGNWNWNAVLLMITMPAAAYTGYLHGSNKYAKWISAVLPVLLCFGMFPFLRSRGALLTLGFMIFAGILLHFKKYRFVLFSSTVIFILILSGIIFYFFNPAVVRFLTNEIRILLFEYGFQMVLKHPFGVGTAAYENVFSGLRDTAYFSNIFAAVRSTHPHNELLYLAGALGIPFLLIFLFLTIRGIRKFLADYDLGKKDFIESIFFCTWIALFGYSMIDLSFHAWPLNLLVLLLTGFILLPDSFTNCNGLGYWRPMIRFFGFIILFFCCADLCMTGYGTLRAELSKRAYRWNKDTDGARHAKAAAWCLRDHPDILYHRILDAQKAGQPVLTLILADTLQSTPNKDFARIHAVKATALAQLKRDKEAIEEYSLDLKRYPHLLLPWLGIANAYGRLGDLKNAQKFQTILREQMKIRNVNYAELTEITRRPIKDFRLYRGPE